MAAALVIACVPGLGVLLARGASGSATLAPPVLSAQPCVLVLALLPALGVALRLLAHRAV